MDGLVWIGWLAIAGGVYLATRGGWVSSWWMTWLWSCAAIGMAFHWSPAAMAYTLNSGYGLGLLVAAPLVIWDALRLGSSYWLAARLTSDPRVAWLPAAFFSMTWEFMVPGVFPWRLGFIQLSWPWLYQPVDIFGACWPTLIAFAHAGLIIGLLSWLATKWARLGGVTATQRKTRQIRWIYSGCILLLLVNGLYGWWSISKWRDRIRVAQQVRFALVQVDPSFTVSLVQSQELTKQFASQADIVCWPESSGGNYELTLDDLRDRDRVFDGSREPERGLQPWPNATCELLLGGKNYVGDRESPNEIYVTAMLLDKNQCIVGRYNKRFLMPFGEYVPGEGTVPGLAALFDMAEHIQAGAGAVTVNSSTGARMGAMLCYEDMVPQASIEMTRNRANVLVSLINGSAFESPYTLKQHRLLAQLRAVECRKYFIRCAATGETCVISPAGDIVCRLPLQQNGVLLADVALLEGQTIFTRFPWLSPILCAFAIVGLVFGLRKRGPTA